MHPKQLNQPDLIPATVQPGRDGGDCTASEPVIDIQHRWGVSNTDHLALIRIWVDGQIVVWVVGKSQLIAKQWIIAYCLFINP